jgi:MFS family permease
VAHRAGSWRLPFLVFASVLSGTVLIPALRPLCTDLFPGKPGAAHGFVAAAALGAVIGGPLLAIVADRRRAGRALAAWASALDGALLLATLVAPAYGLILLLRVVQGGASAGALAILMGAGAGGDRPGRGGMLGAAVIAAVAAGSPVGVALLAIDPRAVLLVAGLLQLAVAAAVAVGGLAIEVAAPPRSPLAGLGRPSAWVFAERFAVGGFVVTFAIWCHQRLGLSDTVVGALVTCFVVSFALSTYPLGKLAERYSPGRIAAHGLYLFGVAFALLPVTPAVWLPVVLVTAGLASGAVYGSALAVAAGAAPGARAAAMGVVHGAGSLGMLLGTAGGGVVSALVHRHDPDASPAPVVFGLVAVVQLAVALATRPGRMASASLARCPALEVPYPRSV